MQKISLDFSKQAVEKFMESTSQKVPDLIYVIAVLTIGIYVSRLVKRIVYKFLLKYNISKGITNFIVYGIYITMLSMVVMTCLEKIGIKTTSIVAVLGAAGFSIGLAFKEILSNIGSGMIILFFKPFKIGDYIQGSGIEGCVEDIQIFSTVLKTPDNKTIIVPNFKLTSDNIVNFTHQEIRRIDFSYNIAYDSDIDLIKEILSNIFSEEKRILDDPKPIIGINSIGNNSIQIVGRPWVYTSDYWDVYFDIMERVKRSFDQYNIVVPLIIGMINEKIKQ
ncbi:mechanosensitive ion channel family protein [Romboutsia sp.]|uniref:mechanosensitive ion channel family protein n=1 Tax=Romboutsia sp. TaxID=1965302 RepID=UPI003F3BFE9D